MKTITLKSKTVLYLKVLCLLSCCQIARAQKSINGNISDDQNEPLPGCSVVLMNVSDSSLIAATFSNMEGVFAFNNLKEDNYLLSLSYTGFLHQSMQVSPSDKPLSFRMITAANSLSEVHVVAKKPFVEQQIDRTVINVKNSITNAGSSVLEVLQKSPGIQINQNSGAISMTGKEGVQVMINGKLSYIPAAALMATLQGMNANNVEKIELITTPPAKYDAGGNAGYINIVLSQRPDEGLNGNASLTAAAFEGTAPAANLDLNYRKNKINLYGGYAFRRLSQLQNVQVNRSVHYEGGSTETHTNSDRAPFQLNNGLRLGMDLELGKRTTLGMLLSGYRNEWQMDALNTSSTLKNGLKDSQIDIANAETNLWKHGMGNFNIQHQFATEGELNFNVDFLKYDNYNPTNYINRYSEMELFIREEYLNSSKKTLINMLPVSLDFTKKLSDKLILETGLKAVRSRFSNDVLVEEKRNDVWTADDEFTADYQMKENVGAGYVSASYNHSEKNSFKAGLRYEYTTNKLDSDKAGTLVDRKYGYLFPTVYWNHKINDKESFNVSYNKRINRPTFNDLAPFLIFMDPNTFISGNAALQPAIADNLSLGYALKMVNFTLNYSHEKYSIGGFQMEVNVENNKLYFIAQNLRFSESLFLTASFPTKITKWWNGQINLSGAQNHAVADFAETETSISTSTFNISGFQGFKVSERVNMELSGFYQSKSLAGVSVMKPFGQLNYGLSLALPASNASLKFGIDNIFSSMIFRMVSDSEELGYSSNTRLEMQKRILKLTYSRSFGNSKVKASRKRSTASETERQRVNR